MKKIFAFILMSVLIASCSKTKSTIALEKVGEITNQTTIQDLGNLFKNDSIVSRYSEGDLGDENTYILDNDTHLIYKKGGELLLSISPKNPLDSLSKIKSITVFGKAYKTKAGVNQFSSFNDLNIHHNIEKLEATFHLVTVFVKDINATFTLDKKDLGIKMFDLGNIKKSQIPEDTKFTSLTIWFN